MKGRVTFWFHLDYDHNAGFVQFKLYGQQCKKCNSGKFEYVMWYPEEVSKVTSLSVKANTFCLAFHRFLLPVTYIYFYSYQSNCGERHCALFPF